MKKFLFTLEYPIVSYFLVFFNGYGVLLTGLLCGIILKKPKSEVFI